MKRILRTAAALAAATLLAGSLAACDEKDPGASSTSSQTEEAPDTSEQDKADQDKADQIAKEAEEQAAKEAAEAAAAAASETTEAEAAELKERAAALLAEIKEKRREGEDPAGMGGTEWSGEGEDPATMQDSDPKQGQKAVEVDYETLPGDCINDVPVALPGIRSGVVTTENLGDDECLVVVSSQGDSLVLADLIAQEFGGLGFTQTSKSQPDQGDAAVNMLSYLTGTHEVHVTVSQDGISGSMIVYALTSPSRGNG